jgi:hypothetical protein
MAFVQKSENHCNIEETAEELNVSSKYYNTGIYGGIHKSAVITWN